jgi:L-threonylcarbamoyladenylate synthase
MGCATEVKQWEPTRMSGSFVFGTRSRAHRMLRRIWDRQIASFDRPRMRDFLCATKNSPHPELVEGRRIVMPPQDEPAGSANVFAASTENIAVAARLIAAGKLVAFPTETVYGLGADATNDHAVARIFEAKERPRFNPLIIHVADIDAARAQVRFDRQAEILAERFWPGALTLVLPRRPDCSVSLLASAGLDSLAVRVPRHPVAQALLVACGRPVAAPSANASGKISPTTAAHVAASLGTKAAMILDGGRCPIGLESTVLDLTAPTPTLLRPGGVTEEELIAAIGPVASSDGIAGDRPKSPGQLASHYAPALPLRLSATTPQSGEALLAFGPAPATGAFMENLSPSGDLVEAAANLFAMLRALDRSGAAAIAVMPIPETGLGRAINNRLRRAAAPR